VIFGDEYPKILIIQLSIIINAFSNNNFANLALIFGEKSN